MDSACAELGHHLMVGKKAYVKLSAFHKSQRSQMLCISLPCSKEMTLRASDSQPRSPSLGGC